MAEDRKLSVAEVRKTISTSLATAFGFVIALLWNQVVQGGLALAKVSTTAPADALGWVSFIVTAVIITVVMIVLIIVIGRWGSKESKKKEATA
jgi:heme/copper-type cytochrome/quinol oxidase subunit 2